MDPVAKRIEQILRERGWTARELSRRASLPSETHVGLLLKRGARRTSGETLAAIAAAAGVSLTWLSTGAGEPEGEAPPPASPRVVPRDAVEEALGDAFDPRRHTALDMADVVRALRETDRSANDPRTAARNLLDAAARLRKRGVRVTAGNLMLAAAEGVPPDVQARVEAEGDAAARAVGMEPGEAQQALDNLRAPRKPRPPHA